MTAERERREYFDAKELDRLRAQALSHALTEYVPPGWLERSNPQQALLGPMLFPASEDGRQWQVVLAFRWDGAQSAILRWSWHEGESWSARVWHSMIEHYEIPLEDALALKESLEVLQPTGRQVLDVSPEAGAERKCSVRLNERELRRLEDEVFGRALQEEIKHYGLALCEKWQCAISGDDYGTEEIEAYRLPGSDDVALFWDYSDWYHRINTHHTGPNRIPREALEALRAGLDHQWRTARARNNVPRWTENIACAADAGMLQSPLGLRKQSLPSARPGPGQTRSTISLADIARLGESAGAQAHPKDRGKTFAAVLFLLLMLAVSSYGFFTADRQKRWAMGGMCALWYLLGLSWLILAIAKPKTRRGKALSVLAALLITAALIGAGLALAHGRGL